MWLTILNRGFRRMIAIDALISVSFLSSMNEDVLKNVNKIG